MGEKGEGSGGEGGGKWGKRGRELGMGYPPVHPLFNSYYVCLKCRGRVVTNVVRTCDPTPLLYIFGNKICLNYKNHNYLLHNLGVIALCYFSYLYFVRSITQKYKRY